MKSIVIIAAVAIVAVAKEVQFNPTYGYLQRYAIPRAEQIRKAEEEYLNNSERISGGQPSLLGQFPYQVGLVGDIIGINCLGVCGGSLISNDRVLTAAHCYRDGRNEVWRFTVVLGSDLLLSGGVRIPTSDVFMHPDWVAPSFSDNIAVIYLPTPVTFSATIAPIALPSGSELNQDFVGASAISSGYGIMEDNTLGGLRLRHVTLEVISNDVCQSEVPIPTYPTNICTSGIGNRGPRPGDGGGPLVTRSNNRDILIGVMWFGLASDDVQEYPAIYTRVTSFLPFIEQHL